MKYQVLTVLDKQLESHGQPMYVQTVGAGVRSFTDEVNRSDENNMLFRHPEDFELIHIAEFDSELGLHILFNHKIVARGRDVQHVSK